MNENQRRVGLLPRIFIALVLATGFGSLPGCGAAAAILLEILIKVGVNLAKTQLMNLVEEKIDEWTSNKRSASNLSNGVLVDPNDNLKGTYQADAEFTVDDEKNNRLAKFKVEKPQVVRDTPTSPWKLAPSVKQKVANHAENAQQLKQQNSK